MTTIPAAIVSLSAAERELWTAAESGKPDLIPTGMDAPLHRMLLVLACQNAGNDKAADELATAALELPAPFGPWAKAEMTYAARVKARRALEPTQAVSLAEAKALEESSEPWAAFAAGRSYLALGLMATQDNRLDQASTFLQRAFDLLRDAKSESGIAVANLELGKLKAWQGRADDALVHLLSGLAIWRGLNPNNSAAIWHQLGSLLLDGRNYQEAVMILESGLKEDATNRTRNALTRALIGAGRLDEAAGHARAVVASEETKRRNNTNGHDVYREMMARYDLGQIALQRRSRLTRASLAQAAGEDASETAAEMLEQAEDEFKAALDLHGERASISDSLFQNWIGPLDKEVRTKAQGKGLGFAELRLVQLELMIAAQKRPAEAARNLAKLADVFGQRGERIQELEAREQSAEAFERSDEPLLAAQAFEQAVRTAELAGAQATARAMRTELARVIAGMKRFGEPRSGFLLRGVDQQLPGCIIFGATQISSGRRARVYEFRVPAGLIDRTRAGLLALGGMFADNRLLPGLPALLQNPPDAASAPLAFDVITDAVEGERLDVAMIKTKGDWKRAVRVIRDISYTVGVLRAAGMRDCRPSPNSVLLDISDNAVCLDILPLRVGAEPTAADEVRHLASLLVEWITGEKAKTRSLALRPGQMRLIFDERHKAPPDLDALLSGILLHKKTTVASPSDLANKLQPFCS